MMELVYRPEHERCFYFDHSSRPAVDVLRIAKGDGRSLCIQNNEIVFFMEGRLRIVFFDASTLEGTKGQILFLPAGKRYAYQALVDTTMVVFRITDPLRLCDNYTIEELYQTTFSDETPAPPLASNFNLLQINPRVQHFLDLVVACFDDGVRCRSYAEWKIREFFFFLRFYYPKKAIYDFFRPIVSGDLVFSEYVRLYWRQFRSVEEFAASMRLTPRRFSAKFKAIFGVTPYKWMVEGRAKSICQQLMTSSMSVKQISIDNGFSTVSQFTKFCKKELGKTPTEIRAGKPSNT